MLMSFRQEIGAVRETLAKVVKREPQDPDTKLLLDRLDYALEELRTADDELTNRAAQLEQLAAEVHAARARYQVLFMMLPVPCVITDLAGIMQAVNNPGALLLGNESIVVGQPLPLRFAEHERGMVRTRITRARLGEPSAWPGTVMRRAAAKPDHAASALTMTSLSKPVNVTLAPLPAPGGLEPSELLWTLLEPAHDLKPQVIDIKAASLLHDGGPPTAFSAPM
jgi:hypothetical protein